MFKVKYSGANVDLCRGLAMVRKNPWLIWRIIFGKIHALTLLDYKLASGYSFLPRSLTLQITYKCNLNCKMCWLRHRKQLHFEEMSIIELKRVIDDVSKFISNIYITGGEPFVREDLTEIIRYIKTKRLICSLTTNGTLISKGIAQQLISSGIDAIALSLDGSRSIHDAIRGKGTFDKTVNAITSLVEAQGNKKLPLISINSTISPLNYHSIYDMNSLAQDLGIDNLRFVHLVFVDRKQADNHFRVMKKLFDIECSNIYRYIFDEMDDVEVIADEILKIKKESTHLNVDFHPPVTSRESISRYYSASYSPPNRRCVAPWLVATIHPNGDLCPCPDFYIPEYVFGNLRITNFKELWNNDKARLFRAKLKKYGFFPGCVRCCRLWRL